MSVLDSAHTNQKIRQLKHEIVNALTVEVLHLRSARNNYHTLSFEATEAMKVLADSMERLAKSLEPEYPGG